MRQRPPAIELWLVDLEKCAGPLQALERAAPRLAPADRERAASAGDPRERRHRVAAYTALRILLERIAGPEVRGEPFVRAAGGKPRLPGVGAEFSLSHIDGLALIGVARAVPVGVDLEAARPVRMAPRRVRDITAAGAGLSDKPLPALATEGMFLQAWARLEAFTKARGHRLAQTLTDVGVRGRGLRRLSPANLEARTRRIAKQEGILVHDVKLMASLHGACAAPRGVRPARVRAFPSDRAGIERLLADRDAAG